MHHFPFEVTMRLLLSILLLVLLTPMNAFAGCAPEKMVKITFRDATPGYEEGHFAKLPKTLYRWGSHFARLEEQPDLENGVHALIVVNNRDTWMINQAVKTGRHIVDKAVNFDFHAPLVGSHDSPFVEFEFGCELAYMQERGVEPTSIEIVDLDLQQYEFTVGAVSIRLMVDPKTSRPWALGVVERDEVVYLLRYVSYETGLEPNMELFTRPADIKWEKAE